MELKNILSKLASSEKEKIETFLAIEISDETVKSACWTVEEETTKILKMGSIEEWEEETKSLISAADSSVTIALEGVKSEPTGIIFGLPESWVEKDQITPPKKKILKKVCDELEFKPLGFVVVIEALIDYLKIIEGTPVSAIFIDLQETQSTITLVTLGKIIGSETVGRSEDLAADVREGLARFKGIESYPSRIILFDGMVDFEEAKQQIISFDWLEALSFLHFPKVESLETTTSLKAVAISGGREVAKSLGFEISEKEKKAEKVEKEPHFAPSFAKATEGKKAPWGKEEKEEVEKKEEQVKEEVTASDFGFVEGKDIVEVAKEKKVEKVEKVEKVAKEEIEKPEKKIKVKEGKKETEIVEKVSSVFSLLFSKIKSLPFHLPSISFEKKPSFLFGITAFLLIGLFVAGFLAYWNLPKAKVTIFVMPKTLEKDLSLTISSSATSVDEKRGIIPGEEKEIEVEGEKSTETTGKALVGEKAKGEVTILNKTDVSKVFPAGTALIGSDNKKFTLDEEVKVASKSSEATPDGEKITYGKATVGVTALQIGTEFNLGGGTDFKFKDYGENLFSARTDEGLSGGTSREVKAVSSEDQDNLLAALTDELQVKAREKLETEIDTRKKVLEKGMEEEIINQQFDKKVDEETDKLSLDLKLKLTTLIFSQDDLNTLLLNSIRESIPSDFTLEEEGIKTAIEEGEIKEGKGEVKAVIRADLIPKLDLTEIKKNIVGRYPQVIEQYLASLPNFVRAEIKISPNLPSKLRTLPRKETNIQLEIEIEE